MDKTDYFDALTAYSRDSSQEIPQVLEQYLNAVAKNGETLFHWTLLKPLIFGKMEQVIGELQKGLSSESIPDRPNVENVPFDVMKTRIMEALHKFNGTPFTIQRLCELLIDPKRHYRRSDKFLRGLEKNVLVVSTVDPFGRKVVSESGGKHLVNGLDTNGSPFFLRDSSISSNLPPVPGWVTTTVSTPSPKHAPAIDSSDQKQTESSSEDCSVTSSSVSGGLIRSPYADHGGQPLAEQTEDVVEETVVTMDTSEAGSLATDGQHKAFVAGEEEDECMEGDDTNSSSSSSSSEELSASDASETSDTAISEPSKIESITRSPWASVISEGENKGCATSGADPYCITDTDMSDKSTSLSEISSSQPLPERQTDSTVSSDTAVNSAHTGHSEMDEQPDTCTGPSSSESSLGAYSEQLNSLNDSTGFDTTFTSESIENTTNEHPDHWSESDDTNSVRPDSDNSAASSDIGPSSPTTNTAVSSAVQSKKSASSTIRSYAEVVASSVTDAFSKNITPPDSTDVQDNMAGLERLVDSVDAAQSSQLAIPVSLSSPLHCPAVRRNAQQAKLELGSIWACSDSEEPQAKRRRLSDDTSSLVISSKLSDDTSSLVMSSKLSDDTSSSAISPKLSDDTSSLVISSKLSDDTSSLAISPKLSDDTSSLVISSKLSDDTSSLAISSKLSDDTSSLAISSKLSDDTSSLAISSKLADDTSSLAICSKLSDHTSSSPISSNLSNEDTIHSSESESISDCTSARSDVMADTALESVLKKPVVLARDQNSEVQGVLNIVSCGEKESAAAAVKLTDDTTGEDKTDDTTGEDKTDDTTGEDKTDDTTGEDKTDGTTGEDKTDDTTREDKTDGSITTIPASVTSDTLNKISSDKEQVMGSVKAGEQVVEDKIVTSENETEPKPMVQE